MESIDHIGGLGELVEIKTGSETPELFLSALWLHFHTELSTKLFRPTLALWTLL